jgi:hypothetical protein
MVQENVSPASGSLTVREYRTVVVLPVALSIRFIELGSPVMTGGCNRK